MLPYRDENPTRRTPIVTIVLLLVNIAVFVLLQFHGSNDPIIDLPDPVASVELEQTEATFLYSRAAIPCEILQVRPLSIAEISRTLGGGFEHSCGKARTEGETLQKALFPEKAIWLSVLMSMFLHGDLLHLAGNMLFLWIFGNNIEDRWGRISFALFYVFGGVAATLGHALAAPDSTVPLVGASGAIAAVMGAYLVLFPRVRIRAILGIFPLRVPAWVLLGVWFVTQFFVAPESDVAWMAHVVGFVVGIAIALLLRTRNRPAEPATALRLR